MAVANLAACMAQTGRKVCRRCRSTGPYYPLVFGLTKEPGLCGVVWNTNRLRAVVQQTKIHGVRVLKVRSSWAEVVDHRNSPAMPEVARKLAEQVDIVLWDSPFVLESADAVVLASLMGGVLLVAARDQAASDRI